MTYHSFHTRSIPQGKVFYVENDKLRDRDNNDLIDSKVIIDDKEYEVRGVESNAVKEIKKGEIIGLLV